MASLVPIATSFINAEVLQEWLLGFLLLLLLFVFLESLK